MKAPFSPLVKKVLKTQEDVKNFFDALNQTTKEKSTIANIGGQEIRIKEVK